ncbi:hypothetical protein [Phenylobacterium sp.]|uniref:hypothetical protein n=1 Tax=Phenylobacterium sp. TaxID=1871053 RepID=UPI002737BF89|nr:hypothetical protein [Phenylobacterium sp.]MDP3869914.1 hypothetical protein [Phenylobacterium sp.]
MSTTLLIDADVVVYEVAMSAETAVNWAEIGEPDLWTIWADAVQTKVRFEAAILALQERLGADASILCLTDTGNWRMAVYPLYKSNRSGKRRPMLLPVLRQFALDNFKTFLRPGLEGDDCLGILGTHPKLVPGDKIICTKDKDLKTIPGQHFNWGKPELGIFSVTPEEADAFHLRQALAGDATDGYPGCPGVGMDTAEARLAEGVAWEQYDREFKSGPRKGTTETLWRKCEATSPWHVVKSHYEKAGLTEDDAIVQARCARILRSIDFNFQTKEPILWTPD